MGGVRWLLGALAVGVVLAGVWWLWPDDSGEANSRTTDLMPSGGFLVEAADGTLVLCSNMDVELLPDAAAACLGPEPLPADMLHSGLPNRGWRQTTSIEVDGDGDQLLFLHDAETWTGVMLIRPDGLAVLCEHQLRHEFNCGQVSGWVENFDLGARRLPLQPVGRGVSVAFEVRWVSDIWSDEIDVGLGVAASAQPLSSRDATFAFDAAHLVLTPNWVVICQAVDYGGICTDVVGWSARGAGSRIDPGATGSNPGARAWYDAMPLPHSIRMTVGADSVVSELRLDEPSDASTHTTTAGP